MTRARNLSRLGNTNVLSVDSSNNIGINSTIPDVKLDVIGDAEISGVITATSFSGNLTGDATGLTGSPDITINNLVGVAATFSGAIDVDGHTELDDVNVSGAITATTFTGALTGDASGSSGSCTGNAGGLTGTPDITVRNITGVAATFTGEVTYEDVTNIDSVGIVTARGGFEIGAAGVGGTITAVGNVEFAGIASDSKGNLRKVIQNTQGSTYTLALGDEGKHILASGTVTVPNSVFSAGDAVTIVNNTAGNLTLTRSITNMYMSSDGTDTATRTLATRGMVTILFASGTVAYISGAGLS